MNHAYGFKFLRLYNEILIIQIAFLLVGDAFLYYTYSVKTSLFINDIDWNELRKKNIVTGKRIKKPNCRYMYDKPKFNRQKKPKRPHSMYFDTITPRTRLR
jgi:hypothetical protein